MLRIMLSTRGHIQAQVDARLRLLDLCRLAGFPVGLELFTLIGDLGSPTIIKKSVQIIHQLPTDVFISLHPPVDWIPDSPRNFFCSPDPETGYAYLCRSLDWADGLGAGLVNIHAHHLLTFDQIAALYAESRFGTFRESHYRRVSESLARLHSERMVNQRIAIENTPFCLVPPGCLDPRAIGFDLCFVSLADLAQVTDPARNIVATVDTCHLAQVYDSSQLLTEIDQIRHLVGHIHFSDVQRIWLPFTSSVTEGVCPGDGRIGAAVSRQLLGYFLLLSSDRDLSLVIETHDEDYINPLNTEKSVKRVLKWLQELQKDE